MFDYHLFYNPFVHCSIPSQKSKFNMSATYISILDNMSDEKLQSVVLKTFLLALEEASPAKCNEIKAATRGEDGTTTVQSILDFITIDNYIFERFIYFLTPHRNQ